MKNILIAGYGFVGQAVHYSITKHDTVKTDYVIDIFDLDKGRQCDITNTDYDFIFVCVPTPSAVDGTCDYSLVTEYVQCFKDHRGLIIKSTVPPSAIKHLLSINSDLVYMPEFLREKSFKYDALNPKHIIIGCNNPTIASKVCILLCDTQINKYAGFDIKIVDPVTASLFKYSANTFLAMKVVFMHELYKMCSDNGYDWEQLRDLMESDDRLGTSHFNAPGDHGLGYAGSCFPKDVKAFVKEANGALSLLDASMKVNTQLREYNVQK